MKKNIFLALDFNSLNKALEVTEKTKDYLAGVKIGLELYSTIGLAGIKEFEKFRFTPRGHVIRNYRNSIP